MQPILDWLNTTFGFKFVDEDMLGTTGKKNKPDGTFEENSSGDIDLNVDERELPQVINISTNYRLNNTRIL